MSLNEKIPAMVPARRSSQPMARLPATMANRNGPALWQSIFEVIGTHWQPCVAGGAVRDYWLRQEPKDIDVFVPATCNEDFTSIIDALPDRLAHGRIIGLMGDPSLASEYQAGEETEVFGVWEGEILGLPVNIVGRKSIETSVTSLLTTFDFGINQCAYRDGQFSTTKAFEVDYLGRIFTLAHNRTYAQSIERFDRINARHGGVYRLVDPFITEL